MFVVCRLPPYVTSTLRVVCVYEWVSVDSKNITKQEPGIRKQTLNVFDMSFRNGYPPNVHADIKLKREDVQILQTGHTVLSYELHSMFGINHVHQRGGHFPIYSMLLNYTFYTT